MNPTTKSGWKMASQAKMRCVDGADSMGVRHRLSRLRRDGAAAAAARTTTGSRWPEGPEAPPADAGARLSAASAAKPRRVLRGKREE